MTTQANKFVHSFEAKLAKVDSAMSAVNDIVWAETQIGMRVKRAQTQRDLVSSDSLSLTHTFFKMSESGNSHMIKILAHRDRVCQDYDLYVTVHIYHETEDEDWEREIVHALDEEVIARLREMLEVVAEMPDYEDEPQGVQDRLNRGYDEIVDVLDELRRMN